MPPGPTEKPEPAEPFDELSGQELRERQERGIICLNRDFVPEHRISAWTTVTGFPNYVTGAVLLGNSIKRHTTPSALGGGVDLVVMEIKQKLRSPDTWRRLRRVGWKRCVVERIKPLDEERTYWRFRDQFTKLHAWGMSCYETLLWFDADAFVIGNIDRLLTTKLAAHGKQIGVTRDISAGKWMARFNMGVFLIHPSPAEYKRILYLQRTPGAVVYDKSMSDQAFLNVVYNNSWHEFGFIYNANLACYTQDRPTWDRWEREGPIRVIHYTMNKPWACGDDYKGPCDIWRRQLALEGEPTYVPPPE